MKKIIIAILVVILLGLGGVMLLGSRQETALPDNGNGLPVNDSDLFSVLARAEGISSLRYNIEMDGPQMSAVGEFWQKEDKIRMDLLTEGQKMTTLIDTTKQTMHVYLPEHNMANKMSLEGQEDLLRASVKDQVAYLADYNPVVVGHEVIDGKDCLIVEYSFDQGEVKMWIWKQHGLPIKSEITTDQGLIVSRVTNIELIDIDDSVFELPAGVTINDLVF